MEFVGLYVKVQLRNRAVTVGKITSIDVAQRLLHLHLCGPRGAAYGLKTFNSEEIEDLEVLGKQPPCNDDKVWADVKKSNFIVYGEGANRPKGDSTKEQRRDSPVESPGPVVKQFGHYVYGLPASSEGENSNVLAPKSKRRQRKRADPGKDTFISNNLELAKLEGDFDFEKNLRLFNKDKEFALIRSEDETDPSSRLVAHNKKENWQTLLNANDPMRKLKNNENVLDS